jgi:hypothetical protein
VCFVSFVEGMLPVADYTPKSDKAEWHLTYRCDLRCAGCNRACFLPPATGDMTLDDAREFCRQAAERNWRPRIVLIGGEPTLHPDFLEFVAIAAAFSPGRVEVWSNGFGRRAQQYLTRVRGDGLARVEESTIKRGSVTHQVLDIFVAPCDFGAARAPCATHSACTDPGCGISVDHDGYSLCCMGGAIDGALQLGARTKRLADLWDPAFAARQTEALCRNCGQGLGLDGARIASSQVVGGTLLSPTWLAAAERLARESGQRSAVSGQPAGPYPLFDFSPSTSSVLNAES